MESIIMVVEKIEQKDLKKIKRLTHHKNTMCNIVNVDDNKRWRSLINVENKIIEIITRDADNEIQ